jgi:hypothetical protein
MTQYIIIGGVAYENMEAYYQHQERIAASNAQISGVSGVGDWGTPAEQQYQMQQNRMKAEFQAEADRAAAARPYGVNTVVSAENPLYSFGNYNVPRDVYYGIHGPNTTERYKAAKAYLEGTTGVRIGGGDRAAPGTTGTVTVDSQGRTIPNYGRNVRGTYDYTGTQSMSLLAGSVQKMAFVPESIRAVAVKGEGMKLAIPTSRLADDNPWNPQIVNVRATERALTLAKSMVLERPGFDASMGLTMQENAASIQKFEKLRQGALAAGNTNLAFDYSRKAQAAAQNLNELSRAYHQAGKTMGIPIASNPYESIGDLGIELMKGTPIRDAERFSPISGELINSLPLMVTKIRGVSVTHGQGLQPDTWNQAMNREKGLPLVVNDFSRAADYIANAVKTGYVGPYGDLYGGKNWQGTTVDRPLGALVGGAAIGIRVMPPAAIPKPVQLVTLEGGMKMPAPFVSVSRSAQDITKMPDLPRSDAGMVLPAPFISTSVNPAAVTASAPSAAIAALPAPFKSIPTGTPPTGIDAMFGGANRRLASMLGFDKMPDITTDQIKATAPMLAAFGQVPVAIALHTPLVSDYVASYIGGEIESMKKAPVSAAAWFGAGIATGAAFRGVEYGVGLGRSAAAEKIISRGGLWRTADTFAGNVMKYAPTALGVAYAADISIRSTKIGTDLSPAAAGRLGSIIGTEARPMAGGAVLGYAAPAALGRASKQIIPTFNRVRTSIGEGFADISKGVPTVTQLKGKFVELRTPATAMSSPASSERLFVPRGNMEPRSWITVRSRGNPAVAASRARLESHMLRLHSTAAGERSPSMSREMYKIMAPQADATMTLSATGLGGEGSIKGFVVGQSPSRGFRDIIPGKPVRLSEIVAKREMRIDIQKPPIYGEVTTRTPGGAALASRVELSQTSLPALQQRTALSPGRQQLYQYQRGRSVDLSSDYQFAFRKLPPGMKRPGPAQADVIPKAITSVKPVVAMLPLSLLQSGVMAGTTHRSEMAQYMRNEIGSKAVPDTLDKFDAEMKKKEKTARALLFGMDMGKAVATPQKQRTAVFTPQITLQTQRLTTVPKVPVMEDHGFTKFTTTPKTNQIIRTEPDVWMRPKEPTAIPLPFDFPRGGGGGGGGFRSSRSWQYRNPVATDFLPGRGTAPKPMTMRMKKFKFPKF